MDPLFLWIGAGLFLLLSLLAVWQRFVDRADDERIRRELIEARETGTHRAIAQYPQINPYLCIGCGICIAACPEDEVIGLVDGIAQVVHGSRCVGHALCEKACPVGAVKVGLGSVALRPDIPILTANMETSIPGIFIAGELGGISLIRNAVDQGAKVAEEIHRGLGSGPGGGLRDGLRVGSGDGPGNEPGRVSSHHGGLLDLVIVGAGPAGLSAGLKSQERGLRFQIIDQEETIGGTIRKYPRRKLTLIQEVRIPLHGKIGGREYLKEEIVQLWENLIGKYQIPVRMGVRLVGIRNAGSHFELDTSSGVLAARRVLLALGRRGTPRKLGVPGEELEKVLYSVVDVATYRMQKILVVGGGDSAVESAIGFADQPGNAVTLSYRKPSFYRLKSTNEARIRESMSSGRIQVYFSSEVKSIADDSVRLEIEQDKTPRRVEIANDFVFILAGSEPPYPLLKSAGIAFGGEQKERAA